MARIHVPNRDTLITILLILAGVLLAMTLFGAGAIWKGKGTRHNSSLERPATGQVAHSETLSSRPEQIIAFAGRGGGPWLFLTPDA